MREKEPRQGSTASRYFVPIFLLAALVILLATLASGLLWCQPSYESPSPAEPVSPVGTWVGADCWENGHTDRDIIVEFSEAGLMTIASLDFTALYRYEDGKLYLFDLDSDMETAQNEIPGRSYDCTITGDFMILRGKITGIPHHHGNTDLIRVSDETGLTDEELDLAY